MNEPVRCPYCGCLMECTTHYRRSDYYGTQTLQCAYVCTECGSTAPPVPVRGAWILCGGADIPCGAKLLAKEMAVKRIEEI